MAASVRRLINFVWGLLLSVVIVDHFSGFSYRHLVRHVVRTDLSLYIEITSIIFTMGVPFFYSLYKRRENELETIAVESGQGMGGLEEARQRNDARIILYYSIMAFFVVVLLFVQSSIINAGKAETSNLEYMIRGLQNELNDYREQIGQMNTRLAKLDSLLEAISGQNSDVQSVLEEVRSIRTSADRLAQNMAKTLRAAAVPKGEGNALPSSEIKGELKEMRQILQDLQMFPEAFDESLTNTLNSTTNELLARLDRIDRSLHRLDQRLAGLSGKKAMSATNAGQPASSEATLSQSELAKLRSLVARYYDDFVATNGVFTVPALGESNSQLSEAFANFAGSSGRTLQQVSVALRNDRDLLRKAYELCQQGKLSTIADCEMKLRWLLWISNL